MRTYSFIFLYVVPYVHILKVKLFTYVACLLSFLTCDTVIGTILEINMFYL